MLGQYKLLQRNMTSFRSFAAALVRDESDQVQLNGMKITSQEGDAAMGQLNAPTNTGDQPTILFLHGLMGQGRMWRNFALNDSISKERDVFLVDLRNHGESDHHASMTYEEMARDVARFAESRGLESYTLIGHNLGAKTAMVTATLFPDQVNGVICLDTAPATTESDKKEMTVNSLKQIKALPVVGKTRKEAMTIITNEFKDAGIANFIANNLVYSEADDHQTVEWSINIDAIMANIDNIVGYPKVQKQEHRYPGLAYFLNGSLSVKYADEVYTNEFPQARVAEVEGAGHYIHIDKGQTVLSLIEECLSEIEANMQPKLRK